jgi:CPA2 family monovalent cation:H+ antiporter-2
MTPDLLSELVVLLVASALVAYLGHWLRVTPIVCFLIAGALIGPHALGLVADEALIEAAAEVGVILLLFTIGIEFSLAKLARIRRLILLGGGLQVGLTLLLVAGVLALFGVGWRAGLFTGCLVALSSTAIVMKLLMDRRETDTEGGQAALGILVFQDLAVVAMVLVVPMLGGERGSAGEIALALAKAAGIVAVVLVVARRVMPRILEAVARTCSQEIFLLTVVAICFGTAWATSLAGVSLSLGAFLAGLVVSESRFSAMVFGEILPLQILFSATFFVSVGLLLDPGFLVAHPLLILGAIGGVLVIKVLATGLSLKALGYAAGTTAFTALLLAQVGEFSFVLERTGRAAGLFPAGLADGGPQAFIAATVVLMMATPVLAGLGDRLRRRGAVEPEPEPLAFRARRDPEGHAPPHGHVIVAGYGEAGRGLARALDARAIPYLIVTLSPGGAREAEEEGLLVLRGNYTRRHELTRAGVRTARLLAVADDDLETTRRVVSAARALNPDLEVVARTRLESDVPALRAAGASAVFAEEAAEDQGIERLVTAVLDAYAAGADTIRSERDARRAPASGARDASLPTATTTMTTTIRLSDRQNRTPLCSHTRQAGAVTPGAEGCEDCLRLGDTWVHLRICMTCGHVGCCDSSKNQHASAHYRATRHPIVKSFEPGETWAWCYEDGTTF